MAARENLHINRNANQSQRLLIYFVSVNPYDSQFHHAPPKRGRRDLNPQPPDRQSEALTVSDCADCADPVGTLGRFNLVLLIGSERMVMRILYEMIDLALYLLLTFCLAAAAVSFWHVARHLWLYT